MTPEQIVHKAIADFLEVALTPPDWFTTFPAGGGGRLRGAFLKSLGLKTGLGDILIIKAFGGRAYWLEIKPGKLAAKDYQKACHLRLALAGSETAVVHSVAETYDALIGWSFSLRAYINGY